MSTPFMRDYSNSYYFCILTQVSSSGFPFLCQTFFLILAYLRLGLLTLAFYSAEMSFIADFVPWLSRKILDSFLFQADN